MAAPLLARKLRSTLLPGLVVGVSFAAIVFGRGALVEAAERLVYDHFSKRAALAEPASRNVAIVALDDDTVRIAGGTWPLPRSALAAIIDEARRAGARVIVVDLILEDPLEAALVEENRALEQAIASGGVVLGAAIPRAEPGSHGTHARDPRVRASYLPLLHDLGGRSRNERFVLLPPLPRFATVAAALGGVSQQQDADGRVRALRHIYATSEGDAFSTPLAAAWLALGKPPVRIDADGLRLGDRIFPVEPDGRAFVRWFGPWDRKPVVDSVYPQVSGALLLEAALARDGEQAPPPAEALAPLDGAVAVIASTVGAAKDKRPTPVNPEACGGEVIATAVDGFLRGVSTARATPLVDAGAALALALLATLVAGFFTASVSRPIAGVALSALGVALLLCVYWLFSSALVARGTWLATALPMSGALLAALAADLRLFGLERKDRRFVHDALGRYTSPALVRTLLERRDLLDRFGGARQELTIYFSDIRGFTTIAEGLEPEPLVALLNEYLSEQTEIVERHGGYVDKYIGDAIMAFWGAPVPAADHAARACRAALEMRAQVERLRAVWKERYGAELRNGAGINTAPVIAGNIGSSRKTNYTVLGDGVNLASRLEGANKNYGTEILVGDRTHAAVGSEFAFRAVDLLRVKGKHREEAVFELVGQTAGLDEVTRNWLTIWDEAMAHYRSRRFVEATEGFTQALALRPDDKVARDYLARCDALIRTPPPEDWSPIFELHDK